MTELVVWNHIPPLDAILIAFLFHSVVRSGPLHLTVITQERFFIVSSIYANHLLVCSNQTKYQYNVVLEYNMAAF